MNVDQSDAEDIFPDVPVITEEQLEQARKSGRYEFIAFEQYKFVAQLVAILARIDKKSKCFNSIPIQQYNVVIGLMNRCARLILGTMELSHKGKFGETSAIIFRCIFETGIKIIWLCTNSSQEKFDTYISDSLKPEIELIDTINKNIKYRGVISTQIEERMLNSVKKHIELAETSEDAIRKFIEDDKRMPDMASLVQKTGFDRIMYLANHRIGSHHVHGTWPSLVFHYLEEKNGELFPRGNNVSTRANELIMASLIMTKAMSSYSEFALKSPVKDNFKDLCIQEEKDLLRIFEDMEKNGW